MKRIILLFMLLGVFGCVEKTEIISFEECVAAGNPVIESYPRQCFANDMTFTEVVETCEDQCGDGNCDQFVCQAIGCPCAETAENCPEDCA